MDEQLLAEIQCWREMLEPFFYQLTRLISKLEDLTEKETEKVS